MDKKGLVAVHINGLAHHATRAADSQGFNPLDVMGVYESNGSAYLAEKRWVPVSVSPPKWDWQWFRYEDYTSTVTFPPYLSIKANSYVSALSEGARTYDYVADLGVQNIGTWINLAATQVSR